MEITNKPEGKACAPKHITAIKGVMSLPSKMIKMFEEAYNKFCGEIDNSEEAEYKAWQDVAMKAKADKLEMEYRDFNCKFTPIVSEGEDVFCGVASTERLDNEGEIADSKFLKENLDYFRNNGSPLLDMHLPGQIIGKVKFFGYMEKAEFAEFVTKNDIKPKPLYDSGFGVIFGVTDPRAKIDIQRGHRNGLSIGFFVDPRQNKGERYFPTVGELSLVDSPCNKDCGMAKAKAEEQAQVISSPSLSTTTLPVANNKSKVEEKTIIKEKSKMDIKLTERQKEKIVKLGYKLDEATELHVKLADLEIEKEDATRVAEKAKASAELNAAIEAQTAELKKKSEAFELKMKELEGKMALLPKLPSKPVAPLTQGMSGETLEQLGKVDSDTDFLLKGKATGEYDLTSIDNPTFNVAGKSWDHKVWRMCKAFAQEISKKIDSGKREFYLSDVKAKFKMSGKAVLGNDTTTTGSYLAEISYSDFIVDEPMRQNALLLFIERIMYEKKDGGTYTIRRRSAYGAAKWAASGAAFSAVHSTYENDAIKFKCLRYDGGVEDFMLIVTSLDALAAELYAAKEAHDQLLETSVIWGTINVIDTTLVKETADSIDGLNEYAEANYDKAGTTVTLPLVYEAEGVYKMSAFIQPTGLVIDPLLYAKVNSLLVDRVQTGSTMLDGGLIVEKINQAAVLESYSLADDNTAAPSFAITKSTGTVNDQVFVRVSAVTVNGETVAAAEANDTMSSAESCIITITNRTADLFYIVYIGSVTGTVYKFYAVAKSATSTTVFTIGAPPTYPTVGLPRKTSADRPFFYISNNPVKGLELAYRQDSNLEVLGKDGTGERFTLKSFVALGVKTGKAILKGIIQKS